MEEPQQEKLNINEAEVTKHVIELSKRITHLVTEQESSPERKIAAVHAVAMVLGILCRAIGGKDRAREMAIVVLDKALNTLGETDE